MIESVPARREHARELAAHLSEESLRSVNLRGPREPLIVIRQAMRDSRESYAVFDRAGCALLFIWGVREIEPDIAQAWFMTSNAVQRHRRAFWRASKEIVEGLRLHYRVICNIIHPENVLTLRWAEAMGFTIHPNVNGYHRAEIRRADV